MISDIFGHGKLLEKNVTQTCMCGLFLSGMQIVMSYIETFELMELSYLSDSVAFESLYSIF